MIIAIDLTPIFDHLSGIERYNINISKEIISHHPENNYILVFKNEPHVEFKRIIEQKNVAYIIIPATNKLLFIQWRLYRVMKKIKADYYLFLSFTSPVLLKKQRIINAIHDLTCWDCPESLPVKMKWYYRFTYLIATKKSWKIVTVSKFSQKRICKKYKIPKRKVPVVYDGLTEMFRTQSPLSHNISEKYGLPKDYIFSLSTIEPRKNIQLLLKAYEELLERNNTLPDLVLGGRQGWKLEEVFGRIPKTVENKIHFIGFIEECDLPQIYHGATLFVFPSKYEGFGLPVIEAMSQGTLVVCSDAASLPEVVGKAGILFCSNNIIDLEKNIQIALNYSKTEKEKLQKYGIEKALSYVWGKEANKLYMLLYQDNVAIEE